MNQDFDQHRSTARTLVAWDKNVFNTPFSVLQTAITGGN